MIIKNFFSIHILIQINDDRYCGFSNFDNLLKFSTYVFFVSSVLLSLIISIHNSQFLSFISFYTFFHLTFYLLVLISHFTPLFYCHFFLVSFSVLFSILLYSLSVSLSVSLLYSLVSLLFSLSLYFSLCLSVSPLHPLSFFNSNDLPRTFARKPRRQPQVQSQLGGRKKERGREERNTGQPAVSQSVQLSRRLGQRAQAHAHTCGIWSSVKKLRYQWLFHFSFSSIVFRFVVLSYWIIAVL